MDLTQANSIHGWYMYAPTFPRCMDVCMYTHAFIHVRACTYIHTCIYAWVHRSNHNICESDAANTLRDKCNVLFFDSAYIHHTYIHAHMNTYNVYYLHVVNTLRDTWNVLWFRIHTYIHTYIYIRAYTHTHIHTHTLHTYIHTGTNARVSKRTHVQCARIHISALEKPCSKAYAYM